MDSVPPTPPASTAIGPAAVVAPAGAAAPPPGQSAVSAAFHTPTVSGKMALTPTHSHGSVKEPYQHKRSKVPAACLVAMLCAVNARQRIDSWEEPHRSQQPCGG